MLGTSMKVPKTTEVKSQVEPHHSLVPHQLRPQHSDEHMAFSTDMDEAVSLIRFEYV